MLFLFSNLILSQEQPFYYLLAYLLLSRIRVQSVWKGQKLNCPPTDQIIEKVHYWLVKHKDPLLVLIRKEQQQLKKLIENIGRHDGWSNEEIEEMFEFATQNISLDVSISSYQATAARQARVISIHGNKPVFCKTCQKHWLLSDEHTYETLTCLICEKKELNHD